MIYWRGRPLSCERRREAVLRGEVKRFRAADFTVRIHSQCPATFPAWMPLVADNGCVRDGSGLGLLDELEADAIHIIRSVAADAERPVMLYSAGKDSSVLLRLATKAFHPAAIPFPLLHVNTGFKFAEMLQFRDETAQRLGLDLRVHESQAGDGHVTPWTLGTVRCCGILKTRALLDALRQGGFDLVIGGARREEERSRAKERVFSWRDVNGRWDPRGQRPEFWQLYNTRLHPGETIRVFPLSDWTELDIWRYIVRERIEVVPQYFAAERDVVVRNGQLIPFHEGMPLEGGERVERQWCRFRTLGCHPCTAAIPSTAGTPEEVVAELERARWSERTTRAIDHDQDGSMERKKREGYF
jgi:sulfate adenylyltransferase subunit 2